MRFREPRLPKRNAWFQFRRLPEHPFGRTPRRVRRWHGFKFVRPSRPLLNVGSAQILNENAETPTICDCMMNRENHHHVVGRSSKNFHSIERTLDKIEWLVKCFERELFNFFSAHIRWKIAKPHDWFALFSNQLNRTVFPR